MWLFRLFIFVVAKSQLQHLVYKYTETYTGGEEGVSKNKVQGKRDDDRKRGEIRGWQREREIWGRIVGGEREGGMKRKD